MTEHLPSPCTEKCKLDTTANVCTGRGRTLAEIVEWGSATASRQHEILNRIAGSEDRQGK
jgi:predicted Fe-S protein YdhL (DUF1289 family)